MTHALTINEIPIVIEAVLRYKAQRSAEARRNGSIYVDHGHTNRIVAKLRAAHATAPV